MNNAGATIPIPLDDLDGATDDVWQQVLAVNLMGDWLRDALDPKLRQVGGRAEVLEAPMAAAIGGATDDAPARGRAAAGAAVDGN